jgi:hypothetical protein
MESRHISPLAEAQVQAILAGGWVRAILGARSLLQDVGEVLGLLLCCRFGRSAGGKENRGALSSVPGLLRGWQFFWAASSFPFLGEFASRKLQGFSCRAIPVRDASSGSASLLMSSSLVR